MPALKRSYDAANSAADYVVPLHRIRNMWQFANLVQWIYIFGKAAKIDDSIDVEVIENEALKPTSTLLQEIALALVKMASSFRGIVSEGLDDQMRKLYRTHAPNANPFGDDEIPASFDTLDSSTKICVLQQLTQWVMIHPERFRDKMDEQRDIDQTTWRIEPYGWDSEDRTYYVLDDNRLYRLTEPPPPPPPAKKLKKTRVYTAGRRSGRRSSRGKRLSATSPDGEMSDSRVEEDEDDSQIPEVTHAGDAALGGMIWECIAVTLSEVEAFLDSISRSRDENEKVLRSQIKDHLLPILQKQEESRKRREQQRERELLSLAKMANAKRSSRIAGKIEQQKQDEENKKEAEQRRLAEATERRAEAERTKRERERDLRMASREERLRERESRRQRHEEELAQLSEDSRNLSERSGRVSERKLQADIERNQQALKELEEEEEDWIFDCSCGLYGRIDDGEHSIACEKCSVWQHSKCIGIGELEAERSDFHFICPRCVRLKREATSRARPAIKLKLHSSVGHSSPFNGEPQSIAVEPLSKGPGPGSPEKEHDGSDPSTNGLERNAGTDHGTEPTSNPTLAKSTSQDMAENKSGINDTLWGNERARRPSKEGAHPSDPQAHSPMPLSLQTPSQTQQNGEHISSPGLVHLLATPSLAARVPNAIGETNGLLSSPAGISPVKSSPQIHAAMTASSDVIRSTKLTLSPITSLAPTPSLHDPTPPIKPLDVRTSWSSETNINDHREPAE